MTESVDPARLASDPGAPAALRELFAAAQRSTPSAAELGALSARVSAVTSAGAGVGAGAAAGLGAALLVVGAAFVVPPATPSPSRGAPTVAVGDAAGAMPAPIGLPSPPVVPEVVAPPPLEPAGRPVEPSRASLPRPAAPAPARVPEATSPAPAPLAPAPPAEALGPTEIELLASARASVAARPGEAMRLVAEHAARFPAGAFAQEREVIAVQALLGLGRRADAERRAARFEARFPGSAHAVRVRALLAR